MSQRKHRRAHLGRDHASGRDGLTGGIGAAGTDLNALVNSLKINFGQPGEQFASLRYCACVNNRGYPTKGVVMAGKHRARTTARRHTEAYALLGTGAITLGLGIALTTGSGVAAADSTNSAVSGSGLSPASGSEPRTTTIRTTISAQSVNTSTYLSAPGAENGTSQAEPPTSVVTTRDSVVRQQNPAVTGDNNPGPAPTLADPLAGQNDQGLTSGIPGLNFAPDIPFIEFGGGGGGLLSKLLSGGLF